MTATRTVRWQAALGWITFPADGPDPSIHLSRTSAEDLLLRTAGLSDTTIVTHEMSIGPALGRALSHELCHLSTEVPKPNSHDAPPDPRRRKERVTGRTRH